DVVVPALSGRFRVRVLGMAEGIVDGDVNRATPDGTASNISAAVGAVRARFRGEPIAAVVVISDGGQTSLDPPATGEGGPPVVAGGIDGGEAGRDREVVSVSGGEQSLDQTSVDLRVTAASVGFGREPFELRVVADNRTIDTRRVTPPPDGSPIAETFTVA